MGGMLLLTFFLTLAPELGWDAHVYHLTGPNCISRWGALATPSTSSTSAFPSWAGCSLCWGCCWQGDGLTSLFHFGYGLLALVVVMGLAGQAFGRDTMLPAGAILLSVTAVLELMMSAYVDITLLFYTTAAFYAFWRWRQTRPGAFLRPVRFLKPDRSAGWLIMLGLFCGFCAGVKYTAVAVPIALGLSLLWTLRRQPFARIFIQGGLLTLVTTLITLPWLLKNWLITGNPFYPFLLHDGLYWNEWRAAWYDRAGTGLWPDEPLRLLLAPLEATIIGTTGTEAYGATIGPFILGLLFLLPLVWRTLSHTEKGVMGHLLFFFGLNYGLWLWGLARSFLLFQSRLLLPMFGITAVIAAVTLVRLDDLTRPARLAVGWLVRVTITSLTLGLILFPGCNLRCCSTRCRWPWAWSRNLASGSARWDRINWPSRRSTSCPPTRRCSFCGSRVPMAAGWTAAPMPCWSIFGS
jgi:4-amino-4-deoxy-L-arabinose transferase-like glycosyltransferase